MTAAELRTKKPKEEGKTLVCRCNSWRYANWPNELDWRITRWNDMQ